MAKNVIKEIIIILLLTLAIILILGVLLYKYTATNKVLPEKVSYTTPENLKQELAEANQIQDEQTVLTYEVTASDLKNYQQTKEYVKGKRNPFSSVTTETTTGTNTKNGAQNSQNTTSGNTNSNVNTNTATNSNNSTSTNNVTTNNSTNSENTENTSEGYFPDTGTK